MKCKFGRIYFDKKLNLYTCYVSYFSGSTQKRKRIRAATEDALNQKLLEFQDAHLNISVQAWINEWLETFIHGKVSPSTYKIYQEKTDLIGPLIGKIKLKDLKPLQIQQALNTLFDSGGVDKQGLSAGTVNSVRKYLKQALKAAVENSIIPSNPATGTTTMKDEEKEIVICNEEQLKTMLAVAKTGQYIYSGLHDPRELTVNEGTNYYVTAFYNLVNLGFATGMRIGEIRALKWTDFDFKRNTVSITRQLVDLGSSKFEEAPLKTKHSKRKISVPKQVMKHLQEYHKYQDEYAEKLGDLFSNEQDLVFTNTFGSVLNINNFRRRYFRKMLVEANMPEGFTIHCMRHTHATLLLKNGEQVQVVSRRLGHSNITVTYNRYTHLVKDVEDSPADTWDKMLST